MGNILPMITKVVGVGSTILIANDIAANTKRVGNEKASADYGTIMADSFVNTTQGSDSPIVNNLAEKFRNWKFDNQVFYAMNNLKNKVKEFGNQLVNYSLPLALALGATFTAIKRPFVGNKVSDFLSAHTPKLVKAPIKGFVNSKIGVACLAALAVIGSFTLFTDILKVGQKRQW